MSTEISDKTVLGDDAEQWTLVITPEPAVNIFRLWEYRDLIKELVYRDYVIYFKQTILGPLWWIFQPVVSMLAYVLVFSVIARISTDGLPPAMFYLSGIMIWGLFSNTLNNCAQVFTSNSGLFRKVYFPRIVIPIAQVLTNFIKFAFQTGFFILCYAFFLFSGYDFAPNWTIVFLPLVILYIALLGMGFGMIFASLTCKYRDITLMLPFIVQIWFFTSGVFIPLSRVPEKYLYYIQANPVIPAMEMFRYMTLGVGTVSMYQVLYAAIFLTVLLLLAVVCFSIAEKKCTDTN